MVAKPDPKKVAQSIAQLFRALGIFPEWADAILLERTAWFDKVPCNVLGFKIIPLRRGKKVAFWAKKSWKSYRFEHGHSEFKEFLYTYVCYSEVTDPAGYALITKDGDLILDFKITEKDGFIFITVR